MLFSTLLNLSLVAFAAAAPNANTYKHKRDVFDKCSAFGSNCADQDQEFCDASRGKLSTCHRFGSDCWIRFSETPCTGNKPRTATLESRDRFDKCSVFGANCANDGNEFCDAETGKLSICHKVPFSSECWIRHTQSGCAAKRDEDEAPAEEAKYVQAIEKRDEFNKCSVFGANCATDGNEFCQGGRKRVCHQVPFSSECWVRITKDTC